MTPRYFLLVKFAWPGRNPLEDWPVYRALEGDESYAYVSLREEARALEAAVRGALPEATFARLALLMELRGASAGEAAPFHYVVETDVLAESEADFNAWYDSEHLAGLASVPGTVHVMRFRDSQGHPRYHACYDLTSPEVLSSPPWLAVRGTPWTARVRPAFFNTKRTMFRRV